MSEEQPRSARTEILPANHRKNSLIEQKRSSPLRSVRPAVTVCCVDCKLPLLIEANSREMSIKSRAGSALESDQLCRECTQEKVKNIPKPSSRLVRSASMNWSGKGDNIETWFEKAPTPDQRVVYNFLQEINNKSNEKSSTKDLDDVLNNLKKYQTRFNSARPRNKLTRLFESSSWRVMRHPVRTNQNGYDNQGENNAYNGSIFTSTDRKMRSTFLIHPNWI